MKYLHKFATQTQFESYYNGENYEEPFVGLIAETSGVSYNKSSVPPVPPPSPYLSVPLTIEITNGSGELTLQKTRIKYKVNDGSWILGNYETISVSSGDTIQLKQDLEVITTSNGYLPLILENSTSNDFEYRVYGNIMSVYQENAFENLTVFDTGDTYAFRNEFGYCVCLTSAENLVLPATTLSEGCYKEMFNYCTGLTTAPELPATTLADECYSNMFTNCYSLTTVPELPATTLADSCYYYMFSNCTGLTTVPSDYLPVTTLAESCYYGMFWACDSLTTAPELPATALAPYCYGSMFRYCRGLTTAPELPATTLANYCYSDMFSDCTSLNYIKCLATNISATSCTSNWVNGVSASGTFVKNPNMSSWATGNSGIPNNWTVQDAS